MMPQFSCPAFLWLALLVPPLFWWALRGRRAALRHPGAGRLAGLPVGRARLAVWGGAGLRCFGLLLLVLALAGPRWPDLRTRVETDAVAIVMLVDISGSMNELDFNWNGVTITRLEAVKRAFKLFVKGGRAVEEAGDGPDTDTFEGRPTDLIGLVVFSTRPETACPLTLSHSALLRTLNAQRPQTETNVSDAVVTGLHRLQAAGARRKVLLLLSDGEHNIRKRWWQRPRGSGWSPRQAAQVAAALNVPIHVIDAGAGSNVSVAEQGTARDDDPAASRKRAVQMMQDIAHITGGRYFSAADTSSLLGACRAIDALERQPVESFQYRRYHEAYPWLGLAALLCWAVVLGLERTLWRRFP
jgi:Ca-activated chloride channel family protein